MADDGKLTADTSGLRQVGREIVTLGDTTAAAAPDSTSSVLPEVFAGANLAGFALQQPLSQIPGAIADATQTLANRFFVLGDLVETAANQFQRGDAAVASAIATAGDLNDAGSKGR